MILLPREVAAYIFNTGLEWGHIIIYTESWYLDILINSE